MKYKKTLISLICATVLSVVLFGKPLLSLSVSTVLKIATKRITGSTITFKKIDFYPNKIHLKNVLADDFHIDEVEITYSLKSKINISLIRPHFNLYKSKLNKVHLDEKFFTKILKVHEGSLELIDGNNRKEIAFDFEKKIENLGSLNIYFDEKKTVCLEFNEIDKNNITTFQFFNTQLSDLNDIALFFEIPWFKEVIGDLNGLFSLQSDKSKMFFNLDFSDLSIINTNSNLKFITDSLHVEMDYCDSLNESELLKRFFSNDLFQKMRFRANFENLKILAINRKWQLNDLNGSFSYNPGVGPKFICSGFAENVQKYDFNIELKGYFNSSFANWMDLDLFFNNEQTKIFLKAKEVEENYNLHAEFDNIQPEFVNAMQNLMHSISAFNDWSFDKGNICASLDCRFNEKGFNKVFVTDLKLNDFHLDLPKKKIKTEISKLVARSSFDVSLKDPLDKFFVDMKIQSSDLMIADEKISDFKAEVFIKDAIFQPTLISCFINDIKTDIDIKGHIKEFNLIAKLKGQLEGFDDIFTSIVFCKRKQDYYSFGGNLKISDEQDAVFGFDIDKFYSLNKKDIFDSITTGWIRAEKVILEKWPKLLNLDLQISGIADIAAFIKDKKYNFQIKGENLAFKNPYLQLDIDRIGYLDKFTFEDNQFIAAKYENGILDADFPLFEGSFQIRKYDLNFDLKKSKIKILKNVLHADVYESYSENVKIQGDIYYDIPKAILDIKVNQFSSDISSFQKLVKHFKKIKMLDLIGTIYGTSQITFDFFNETKFDWNISAKMQDAFYSINDNTKIQNLIADINYCSKEDFLEILDIKSDLILQNNSYKIYSPVLQKDKNFWSFDVRCEKDILDVFRIKGDLVQKDEKCYLTFDKYTHFYTDPIKVSNVIVNKSLEIENLEIVSAPKSSVFLKQMQFLSEILSFQDLSIKSLLNQKSSGDFKYKIFLSDNKAINLSLNSLNFSLGDKRFDNFKIEAEKKDEKVFVKKLLIDDFDVNFYVDIEKEKFNINDFELKKRDSLFLLMQGFYIEKDHQFTAKLNDVKIDLRKIKPFLLKFMDFPFSSIDGYLKGSGSISFDWQKKSFVFDWDLHPSNLAIDKLRLSNNGPLNLNFTSDRGLILQGVDLSFSKKDIDLAYVSCSIGQIVYNFDLKKWYFKDANLSVPNRLISKFNRLDNLFCINDDIQVLVDVEYTSDESCLEIFSKQLSFLINDKRQNLRNIFIKYQKDASCIDFEYFHLNKFYPIKNTLSLSNKIYGKTTFFDEKDKTSLFIDWRLNEENAFRIKNIQGSFCGLDASFQKHDKKNLFGSVKADFTKLSNLLSNDLQNFCKNVQVGKGYELSGLLKIDFSDKTPFDFEGLFAAKDFDLLGYRFKTLLSHIKISKDDVKINDFKISDNSGILIVNDISIKKEKDWNLVIPHIKIRDLRPSLLQATDQPLGEIEPFLIRDLNIFDFQGSLSDRNSFTGKGNLYFINSFKRGHSVFDFPSDVLSRIVGLDLELITPVMGKIDFNVKDAKFYLTEMKDSFSQGKRSKFFLSEKGQNPFIDFDGNMHINIAMKQYVLFKFTESFIISIRGNLDKPDCNLKKKRGFLN